MSQIKIHDLLPLLRPGWVAADNRGRWYWFRNHPKILCINGIELWGATDEGIVMPLTYGFDILPYDGDWKDSLMECGK